MHITKMLIVSFVILMLSCQKHGSPNQSTGNGDTSKILWEKIENPEAGSVNDFAENSLGHLFVATNESKS